MLYPAELRGRSGPLERAFQKGQQVNALHAFLSRLPFSFAPGAQLRRGAGGRRLAKKAAFIAREQVQIVNIARVEPALA